MNITKTVTDDNNKNAQPTVDKNYKPLIIAGIVLFAVLVMCLGWYLHQISANEWEFKQQTVTIELGDNYHPTVADIVDLDKYPNVNEKNTDIWVRDAVIDNEHGCIRLGEYDVLVQHTDEYKLFGKVLFSKPYNRIYKLKVVDTTPPKWEDVITKFECTKDCKKDLTGKFSASDLSNVKITINDNKVDYSRAGEYTAVAIAKDEGGNEITQNVTIRVKYPVVSLSETSLSINVNDSAKLEVKTIGKNDKVAWKSANDKIATVRNGVVTGTGQGTTVITATANDVSASCEVIVRDKNSTTTTTTSKEDVTVTKDKETTQSEKTTSATTTKKSTTTTEKQYCVDRQSHSVGCGNIGKWYSSKEDIKKLYKNTRYEYKVQLEKGKISKAQYNAKCPRGYDCWKCSYCGKWTANFKYNK